MSCDKSPGGREGPWSAESTAFTADSSWCCTCAVLGVESDREACRALVSRAVPPVDNRPCAASAGHAATCNQRQTDRQARTHSDASDSSNFRHCLKYTHKNFACTQVGHGWTMQPGRHIDRRASYSDTRFVPLSSAKEFSHTSSIFCMCTTGL